MLITQTSDAIFYFFFNDTATTEIYTLSLHDALPISPPQAHRGPPHAVSDRTGLIQRVRRACRPAHRGAQGVRGTRAAGGRDRKSTRLNSSHANISYAVFCLKNKPELLPPLCDARKHF